MIIMKSSSKNRTSLAASKRVKKLREEISRLRFLYHVSDDSNVTDDVYDSLNKELKLLLDKHPEYIDLNAPENRVGGKPLDKFKKVQHDSKMFSMNDAFNMEEISSWEKRISKLINHKHSYFCEIKLDGLSASLIYKKGIFIRGATRGDGLVGEDVTENLKMIGTLPLKLKKPYPDYLEIRGEVVMSKRVWRNLNKKQEKENKPTFANTRNAAAGSLRQLDPKIAKSRQLDFFAWEILGDKDGEIDTHSEKHNFLRSLGFQVAPYEKRAKNLKEVSSFIDEVEKIRDGLPYGTDGMVVSVDELGLRENLGHVGKAPRYMIAYKYPAEKATTKVIDITVNVGRTGVLTPLAHFNPTLVAGSTVSKATLHNMDQINRLDIRIGDTIVIQKAGDVIPEVVEVLDKLRTGKEKKFKMPKVCPVCNSNVSRKEGGIKEDSGSRESFSSQGPRMREERSQTVAHRTFSKSGVNSLRNPSVAYYCTNKNCPARNKRGLEHFVKVFEIYEIGPKILNRLKDEGLISDAADLFTLEKADLSGLERFGEKSADNIISSIQSHKKISLWRFIYSLGIIHVGEQTSQDLANYFGSLEKMKKSTLEEIDEIENIGPAVAKSIFDFFRDKTSLNLIQKFLDNGITFYKEKTKKTTLSGKVFVLTGTLLNLSREELKKKIIENGGKVSSSVSSKTTYVVSGKDPGSKYNQAKKLGVKILSEEEFIKIL